MKYVPLAHYQKEPPDPIRQHSTGRHARRALPPSSASTGNQLSVPRHDAAPRPRCDAVAVLKAPTVQRASAVLRQRGPDARLPPEPDDPKRVSTEKLLLGKPPHRRHGRRQPRGVRARAIRTYQRLFGSRGQARMPGWLWMRSLLSRNSAEAAQDLLGVASVADPARRKTDELLAKGALRHPACTWQTASRSRTLVMNDKEF